MTTVTASPIAQARAIRAEVAAADWPRSREAQWAVDWALGELDEALAVHAALLDDDGFPGEDQRQALEAAEDEVLERAKALRNRLAQVRADEETKRRKAAEAAANAKGEAAA